MESLAATKELLFAFGAGVYLVWLRWRRLKSREMQTELRRQKEQLDTLLVQNLRIEEIQMRTQAASLLDPKPITYRNPDPQSVDFRGYLSER